MFDKLLKAAIGTVLLPVDVVIDVGREIANFGDIDQRPSQTQKRMYQIGKNIDEALK